MWYRSSWEIKVMRRFDRDPSVESWSSEEVVIPYRDKSTGRLRRYFPDFAMKRVDGKKFLIEVKPERETVPPVKTGKSEKRFISECLTYAKNASKWQSARKWCEDHGYEFVIITEKNLGIKR